MLDESDTDIAECCKIVWGREVMGAVRSLVNARNMQLDCAKVLYEALFVPVLLNSSETTAWRGKKV